eukprot:678598-Prymnesium_polylepis.1
MPLLWQVRTSARMTSLEPSAAVLPHAPERYSSSEAERHCAFTSAPARSSRAAPARCPPCEASRNRWRSVAKKVTALSAKGQWQRWVPKANGSVECQRPMAALSGKESGSVEWQRPMAALSAKGQWQR